MSNWMNKLHDRLISGQKPTYEELEEALAGALQERAAYKNSVEELSEWLGKISVAFLKGDVRQLVDVVSEFVDTHLSKAFKSSASSMKH